MRFDDGDFVFAARVSDQYVWGFAVVEGAYVSSERGFCISSWIFASGAPEAILDVVASDLG